MKPGMLVRTLALALASLISLISLANRVCFAADCVSPPSDLVGWWRAEGDFVDSVSGSQGVNQGAVTFTGAEVGQAFAFDGTSTSFVEVPDSPMLQIPDVVTLEFWVKRLRLTYP